MRLICALWIVIYAATWDVPAYAQPEPSARRVFLLCQMEDPQCGTLLREAYNDFLVNPTITECYTENFGGNGVYDQRRRCWNTTTTCHFVRNPEPTIKDIFMRYMNVFPQASMYWNSSPRVMMYLAMNLSARCK